VTESLSATAAKSSSPARSDGETAQFFGLGQDTADLQTARVVLNLIAPQLGDVERTALSVLGAMMTRSGIAESARLGILTELAKQGPVDLSTAAFAVLDGATVICSQPGGKSRAWRIRDGVDLPEAATSALKPFITSVFHVSAFYRHAKRFHAQ
jgi:hypothetical protein